MDPRVPSQGPVIVGVSFGFLGVAAIFLATRIYCKVSRFQGLWWDDYLLLAAWSFLCIHVITVSIAVSNGFGKHIWDIDMNRLSAIIIPGLVSTTASFISASLAKTSFILTLLRITFCCAKHFLKFALVSMNVCLLTAAWIRWIDCTPISYKWDRTIEGGKCWPKNVMVYVGILASAYSAFLDLVLSILPWKLTSKMHMVRSEKIAVAFAMSCGIFGCVAAIMKCVHIPSLGKIDFTWEMSDLAMWTVVEPAVIIVAASIPTLRAMFRDIRSEFVNRGGAIGGGGGGGGNASGIQVTCGSRGNCKTTKTITIRADIPNRNEVGETTDTMPKMRDEVDAASDKSILGRAASPSNGKGILQISEIKVTYTERKQSNAEHFEMENV